MAFTGKCTFTAGSTLPEIAEDISDIVSIVSPYETPLLDALGDAHRPATSTRHEWFEDALLANADTINQAGLTDTGGTTTALTVAHGSRFRVGDLVAPDGTREVMLVTAVNTGTNQITVTRGYGATAHLALTNNQNLHILGNAALEGSDAPDARFSVRSRLSNYTQIFATTVQVSGSEAAVKQAGVADEMDYQKTNRLRELLRDLENTVINGVANDATPVGSATARRTMRGILPSLQTHIFVPGSGGYDGSSTLDEPGLNEAMRLIWESAGGKIDLIVCGGKQKRRINSFISDSRRYSPADTDVRSLVSTYESDFGVCRIVVCRQIPTDTVLLLDSSRIAVVPLVGRSFQFRPLAPAGDYESGELVGEYTLELRNEAAHGAITQLV